MSTFKRITKIFKSSVEIPFDDSSKIVLMSDCHRGTGGLSDAFSKNQNLYFVALKNYYNKNFTYIEIGDGDELWKSTNFSEIKREYSHIFWYLSNFYKEGRLHFIFGNHDIIKKSSKFVKNNLYEYYNEHEKKTVPLFENIQIHEGLVLKYTVTHDKILLAHGHQGQFLNDKMWYLGRLLCQTLWEPLSSLGINDPTNTAKNYDQQVAVEKKLIEWAKKKKTMLIAGHTHRPVFPKVGKPPYFNAGSSVHPRCITALEISQGTIALVKWNVKTKEDGTLYIGRDILEGPTKLTKYFDIYK
ncbi:metallophosphoesterase family protein [Clostridium swellfunianum]|uniref:metallophosphoesterase n=1 Tax=Clostridium swellfunianum TaxID=1367462 RepID=UPI00202DE1AB|nr:metallophosphoesterase [Clostridium swellfunianum]MCM0648038.1 metallophosphoesterase family protein [Clostridium swellfunianum]